MIVEEALGSDSVKLATPLLQLAGMLEAQVCHMSSRALMTTTGNYRPFDLIQGSFLDLFYDCSPVLWTNHL